MSNFYTANRYLKTINVLVINVMLFLALVWHRQEQIDNQQILKFM